jgi:hypothetical protein
VEMTTVQVTMMTIICTIKSIGNGETRLVVELLIEVHIRKACSCCVVDLLALP